MAGKSKGHSGTGAEPCVQRGPGVTGTWQVGQGQAADSSRSMLLLVFKFSPMLSF